MHHLVERGRTRIATIAGPADMPVGIDRLDGYRDALPPESRKPWRLMVEHGDFSALATDLPLAEWLAGS